MRVQKIMKLASDITQQDVSIPKMQTNEISVHLLTHLQDLKTHFIPFLLTNCMLLIKVTWNGQFLFKMQKCDTILSVKHQQ